MKKILLLSLSLLAIPYSIANAQHRASNNVIKYLDGYKCMQAGKTWTDADYNRWVKNGRLPNDPSVPKDVPVYRSADVNANEVGTSGNIALVNVTNPPVNNRLPVMWPNGKTVWINVSDLSPYKVATNPNAKCYPALLSNGRYGFTSTPPHS